MTRVLLVAALAAAAFAPAANAAIVTPCHGSDYRYGAIIWHPTQDRPIRMCIEQ